MYKIGELIIYGNEGVCKVEDIGVPDISGINKNKKYYTLKPVYENSKIFVPTNTNIFMRKVKTYEEIQKLIKSIPSIEEVECDEKNAKSLEAHYKKLLETHECIDLLTIITGVYEKKETATKNGKKLSQVDLKFMKIAKSLIDEEFSVVLGILREEVQPYINEKVKMYS